MQDLVNKITTSPLWETPFQQPLFPSRTGDERLDVLPVDRSQVGGHPLLAQKDRELKGGVP